MAGRSSDKRRATRPCPNPKTSLNPKRSPSSNSCASTHVRAPRAQLRAPGTPPCAAHTAVWRLVAPAGVSADVHVLRRLLSTSIAPGVVHWSCSRMRLRCACDTSCGAH
mmetsp:Transcript_52527/g.114568  ORF Transcript_52527/g.114568 Transcript_52527/m.114568 type:complete len:109 (+) Transcript_52527:339-665(+)